MVRRIGLWVLAFFLIGSGAVSGGIRHEQLQPEPSSAEVMSGEQGKASSDIEVKKAARGKAVVVTANHYATEAAADILARGGNAVDAAVAAQLVLGLVEPQSSGLGGGGFLLFWSEKDKRAFAYNGRERASLQAKESYFMQGDKPMDFWDAVIGGYAVGVPGIPKMLYQVHGDYGRLDWEELFSAALSLAHRGFVVSKRLNKLLSQVPYVNIYPDVAKLYFPSGKPVEAGVVLKNPAYAYLLESLSKKGGVHDFYTGKIAGEIVKRVTGDPYKQGILTAEDLRFYHSIKSEVICANVWDYRLCSAPPPSSGGVTIFSLLKTLSLFDQLIPDPNSFQGVHYFAQSSNLAFADRNFFVADPLFQSMDYSALWQQDYIRERGRLIEAKRDRGIVEAGKPEGLLLDLASQRDNQESGTTHLSIVDKWGNAVSFTSSIETAFGSRIMVGGTFLNSQLTDFSFKPSEDGVLVANRIAGGKRPRSSMAPLFVFDKKGELYAVLGSPGGARIIHYLAGFLWKVLAYDYSLQRAMGSGHFVAMNRGELELEKGFFMADKIQKQLLGLGYSLVEKEHTSGIHAIVSRGDHWEGIADFRREGKVWVEQ